MSIRQQQRLDALIRSIGEATSIQTWRPIWECLTDDELDRVEVRMNRLARSDRATTPVREARELGGDLVVILKAAAARVGSSNEAGAAACSAMAASFEAQLKG